MGSLQVIRIPEALEFYLRSYYHEVRRRTSSGDLSWFRWSYCGLSAACYGCEWQSLVPTSVCSVSKQRIPVRAATSGHTPPQRTRGAMT